MFLSVRVVDLHAIVVFRNQAGRSSSELDRLSQLFENFWILECQSDLLELGLVGEELAQSFDKEDTGRFIGRSEFFVVRLIFILPTLNHLCHRFDAMQVQAL